MMLADLKLSPRQIWKMKHRQERMQAKGYPENQINLAAGDFNIWQGIIIIEESARL